MQVPAPEPKALAVFQTLGFDRLEADRQGVDQAVAERRPSRFDDIAQRTALRLACIEALRDLQLARGQDRPQDDTALERTGVAGVVLDRYGHLIPRDGDHARIAAAEQILDATNPSHRPI